ncbi:RHS repeat-associated core domain-containing protein [Humisphaera borealis]|uniref:RHS repeat-associated core domain-containing protein n=1 Tax=Humisphaera borealis TaxID=2807512 RepID=A0A7M2X2W2_9BACT|nr:RHS repeat-associated core domain-containing protein [Humisphaera borealis]QOV92098.1 hypothetical protein IPV69_12385 [Humisphaera borealis]
MSYRASLGRWLEPDPIDYEGGTNNLYEFVDSNSVRFVDPIGLQGDDPSQWTNWSAIVSTRSTRTINRNDKREYTNIPPSIISSGKCEIVQMGPDREEIRILPAGSRMFVTLSMFPGLIDRPEGYAPPLPNYQDDFRQVIREEVVFKSATEVTSHIQSAWVKCTCDDGKQLVEWVDHVELNEKAVQLVTQTSWIEHRQRRVR